MKTNPACNSSLDKAIVSVSETRGKTAGHSSSHLSFSHLVCSVIKSNEETKEGRKEGRSRFRPTQHLSLDPLSSQSPQQPFFMSWFQRVFFLKCSRSLLGNIRIVSLDTQGNLGTICDEGSINL